MKKSVLLLGNLFAFGVLFSQQTPVSQTVQNKNAVLEELTGINCTYCPDGHKRANALAAANPGRVILVNVHAGGYANTTPDLRTTDGNLLDPFFDPEGYPAGTVQRTPYNGEAFLATSRGNWATQVNQTLGEVSPVNVAMNATLDASTRELTVNVEIFYTAPFASGVNHYLNVGILQNNIEGPQVGSQLNPTAILPNGNYNHLHVFRGYINAGGTWGEAIDASQTGVITKTITYTLPEKVGLIDLNLGELQFFAFVHEGHNAVTTSKILSGAEITPTVTNIPGPTAGMESIVNEMNVCPGTDIAPVVKVKNIGDVVTSLDFSYSVNGGTASTYTWNGTIPFYGTQEITLPAIGFTPQGTNNVSVTLTGVNGGTGTLGAVVTKTKAITLGSVSGGNEAVVKITTDRYGSETTWNIKNSTGTVVASGGPYTDASANGAYPQEDVYVTLANDCYSLNVYDSYGDGYDGGFGNGKVEVKIFGNNVSDILTFTGSEKFDAFQIETYAGLNEFANAHNLNIYPNPTSDVLNVSFDAQAKEYTISILDIQGREVATHAYSNLSGQQTITLAVDALVSGNYLVKIASENGSTVEKVLIK